MQLAPPPMRILDQVQAFQYVTVEKAPIYRAIVQIFSEARQHYVVELRPTEVLDRIRAAGIFLDLEPGETLDYHLDMLVKWGNLASSQDAATVARLEDFYRKRLLYRLTAVGEAAHQAVSSVEETIGRTGKLQASMLVKIRDELRAMTSQRGARELVLHLHALHAAFSSLTEEANRFIGDLDRSTGERRMDEERFALYKQALLIYINRFIDQLRLLGDEIRGLVEGIDIAAILELALPAAEIPPAMDDIDPHATWLEEERARWSGVRAWFIGDAHSPPTVERLAAVAVDAVVGLTRSLGRLSGGRLRAVDRAADFRTLARWFAACQDDRAAHVLWNGAFGLSSARHFHLAEDEDEAPATAPSWWEAKPVEIPVRLRERGSAASTGRAAAIPDHAATRQWMEMKRRQEKAQLDEAIRRFAGKGAIDFRDIGTLNPREFDLLLAMLDQALAAPLQAEGVRETRSIDGRLQIRLLPPVDDELVSFEPPDGRVWCRNHRIEVVELVSTARISGVG